ncbi:MAG: hypothetical protein IT200_14410 [Thermoleophilia bacterium]|nr:hypothetical protein [Thermoleophilia bacterium]
MRDALDLAHALAGDLAGQALWHAGRCTWMGPVMADGTPDVPVVATLPADLYLGTAGIGLALACAGAATGDALLRRTATGALRQSSALLRRHRSGAGLFDGATGVALAAALAGRVMRDRELLDLAAGVAAGIAEPEGTDLIGGAAGTALGLIALDALLPGAGLGRRGRTIATRLRGTDGAAMGTGLAHGASGVALALAEAGFAEDAARVLGAEDTRFDPHAGNWRDMRPGRLLEARTFACAWCHGAPGIAIARTRARDLGVPVAEEPLAGGLRTIRAQAGASLGATGADLTLCHGTGGLAEALAVAGMPDTRDTWAAAVAAEVADGIPIRCGLPGGRSLGLMTGIAGVIHTLVRIAVPRTGPALLPGPWPAAG